MVGNVRRYVENVGPLTSLLNAGFLAWILYFHFRLASQSPGQMLLWVLFVLPVVLLGLFGPLLIRSLLARNAGRVLKAYRYVSAGVVIVIILSLTGNMPQNLWLFLAFIGVVFACHGVTFWTLSHPSVYTQRRLA
ncbi:MAG: hypothetical protein AAFS11_05275 [Planctomycetota bacterium]